MGRAGPWLNFFVKALALRILVVACFVSTAIYLLLLLFSLVHFFLLLNTCCEVKIAAVVGACI